MKLGGVLASEWLSVIIFQRCSILQFLCFCDTSPDTTVKKTTWWLLLSNALWAQNAGLHSISWQCFLFWWQLLVCCGGARGALCVLVRWHPLLAIAKRSTDLCSFHRIHQALCVIFVGISPHYCGPNPSCYPLFKNWFICWISSYSC